MWSSSACRTRTRHHAAHTPAARTRKMKTPHQYGGLGRHAQDTIPRFSAVIRDSQHRLVLTHQVVLFLFLHCFRPLLGPGLYLTIAACNYRSRHKAVACSFECPSRTVPAACHGKQQSARHFQAKASNAFPNIDVFYITK